MDGWRDGWMEEDCHSRRSMKDRKTWKGEKENMKWRSNERHAGNDSLLKAFNSTSSWEHISLDRSWDNVDEMERGMTARLDSQAEAEDAGACATKEPVNIKSKKVCDAFKKLHDTHGNIQLHLLLPLLRQCWMFFGERRNSLYEHYFPNITLAICYAKS